MRLKTITHDNLDHALPLSLDDWRGTVPRSTDCHDRKAALERESDCQDAPGSGIACARIGFAGWSGHLAIPASALS